MRQANLGHTIHSQVWWFPDVKEYFKCTKAWAGQRACLQSYVL